MSTPDPKIVREIARKHILDDRHRAHDNGSAVLGRFGPDGLTKPEYHAYCDAIRETIRTAQIAVSWPDDQRPANPTTGERQDGAAEEVRTFLAALLPRIDIVADWTGNGVRGVLTAEALRAVLAERDALATRVVELEGEREADARAVADAIRTIDRIWAGEEPSERLADASAALRGRFDDGITTLAGDETGGSGEPPACPDCGHWTASHYLGDSGKHDCALCGCPRSLFDTRWKT